MGMNILDKQITEYIYFYLYIYIYIQKNSKTVKNYSKGVGAAPV